MPGGYLEARGGHDAIKPSGGTAADPISAGIFTGGHEHSMADGFIWTATTGGTVFSANLAQRGYFDIWPTSTAANDAIYIGSNVGRFSRVVFYIGQGTYGATDPTLVFEYPTAADWSATASLTTTSTPNFETTGEQVLEFAIPASNAWVASVRNGVYGYFVRIRVSALNDGVTTKVTQTTQRVYSDWPGARQIYEYSANAAAATNNATLKWYGQSSSSVVAWNSVSTSLFSGNFARARFASYRNILYLVNGKESKRWDNNALADMGFTKPSVGGSFAWNIAAGSGLTGYFEYSISYGYGPAGEWGESDALNLAGWGAAIADNEAVATLDLQSIPATAEKIYVYRTTDMTDVPGAFGVAGSATSSFPRFRIQTLSRDATGSFPTTFTDNTEAFPFPPVEMDVATNAPPTRTKFIGVHKNRLFLGSNNQYPGRVWWSDPFEAEAFNTDENFADFTRSTGGQLTGIIEFSDQMVCFTEDQMFGIANVDQDVPSIYVIHPSIGCIAPDSIQAGFGVLCWLARNGVYVWDGNEPPRRVSDHMSTQFGSMSLNSHGGSRCVLHNRLYECHLIDNNNTFVQSPRPRYDLVTNTWATMDHPSLKLWAPLCVATMPIGHVAAGERRPIYGQGDKSGSDFAIYVGDVTTQDAGVNYTCVAVVHFGPTGLTEAVLNKAYCYFLAADGWATPALSLPNAAANFIGSPTGTLTNLTGDSATDYTRISGIPAEGSLGSGDLLLQFSVASAAGGTVRGQRLLAMGIDIDSVPSDWGKS